MKFLLKFIQNLKPKLPNAKCSFELDARTQRDIDIDIEVITLPSGHKITLSRVNEDRMGRKEPISEHQQTRPEHPKDGAYWPCTIRKLQTS